ncbi:MAG TPA: ABC transporter permease, partial [Chitinophagaceae bacterium]|nr:ABC transporter permease [Chitinophagaceae bacterium]
MWRNKTNSFLNIFGLAIGIACAGLIFLWVEAETNYDSANLKKGRLYIVRNNQNYDAGIFTHSSTPGILAPSIKEEIPGIANASRITEDLDSKLFTIGDKSVYASGKYAETSLFNMFTLPFAAGDAGNAFTQIHSLVITEKTAKKFFPEDAIKGDDYKKYQNIIGKRVRVDNQQDYVVTGILKDLPENSSLQFEWLSPFEIYFQQSPWAHKWENSCLTTYVELDANAHPASINKTLYNYVQKRAPASISHLFLFAMNDWHLYDDFQNGKKSGGGRIEYVRLFSIIAWIILFIACINFMNLATAQSEKRAREVGVRKVLGAGKKSLIFQFIGEALFMTLLAAAVSFIIVSLVLPAFNTLVQKNLSTGLNNPIHLLAMLFIAIICGLIAGSYPSFYLSAFNPVFVLKGVKFKTGSAAFIRKGLVVLQFTISIILIIGTIIIYRQIQHIKNRSLGFNKDNLIEMNVQGDMQKHFSLIKQDLLNTGVIENVALADHETIYGGNNTDDFTWEGKTPGNKILISNRAVTPEYFSTNGIKIIEGRGLQINDSIEATATNLNGLNVVITQSFARLMGTGSAIGKSILSESNPADKATVVGVVNDYIYGDMYGKPDPVIFIELPSQYAKVMYLKIKPGNPEKALAQIASVMKKDNAAYPFDYRFVDDQFNQMFLSEMLISKLSRVFAALAIIISCLGLFGLAAYTAERRTREIGIRKVLGASVSGIASLLSKDFLKLV